MPSIRRGLLGGLAGPRRGLSSHDVREVLGLATATKVNWIEIKWPQPSGRVERFTDVPIDRYVTVVEGKGRVE